MKVDDKVGGVLEVVGANAATHVDVEVHKWNTIYVFMRDNFEPLE